MRRSSCCRPNTRGASRWFSGNRDLSALFAAEFLANLFRDQIVRDAAAEFFHAVRVGAFVARHEIDSILVPPGDPLALAKGLNRVLADADLAQRLRLEGSFRAEEHSMDRLASRYVELYRTIV